LFVFIVLVPSFTYYVPQHGSTALHYAAYAGKMRIVKYLVEDCKAVFTNKNDDGDTPGSGAAKYWHTNIVRYFKARVMMTMVMEIELISL